MKNKTDILVARLCGFFILIMLGAILALGCNKAHAQTNSQTEVLTNFPAFSDPTLSGGLQQIWDATTGSTNFAVVIGGGRGIKGDKNLAFADYVYNLSDNVGLIVGYDGVRMNGNNTYNFVKGGLNLKAEIQPLKNFGLDWKFQPFVSLVVLSRAGNIGQAEIVGINKGFKLSNNWNFNVGGFYENRNGNAGDASNGVYLCGMFAFSRGF